MITYCIVASGFFCCLVITFFPFSLTLTLSQRERGSPGVAFAFRLPAGEGIARRCVCVSSPSGRGNRPALCLHFVSQREREPPGVAFAFRLPEGEGIARRCVCVSSPSGRGNRSVQRWRFLRSGLHLRPLSLWERAGVRAWNASLAGYHCIKMKEIWKPCQVLLADQVMPMRGILPGRSGLRPSGTT